MDSKQTPATLCLTPAFWVVLIFGVIIYYCIAVVTFPSEEKGIFFCPCSTVSVPSVSLSLAAWSMTRVQSYPALLWYLCLSLILFFWLSACCCSCFCVWAVLFLHCRFLAIDWPNCLLRAVVTHFAFSGVWLLWFVKVLQRQLPREAVYVLSSILEHQWAKM